MYTLVRCTAHARSQYRIAGSVFVSACVVLFLAAVIGALPLGITNTKLIYGGWAIVGVVCLVGPAMVLQHSVGGFSLMAVGWLLACSLLRMYSQAAPIEALPAVAYALPAIGLAGCTFLTVFCSWPKHPASV